MSPSREEIEMHLWATRPSMVLPLSEKYDRIWQVGPLSVKIERGL